MGNDGGKKRLEKDASQTSTHTGSMNPAACIKNLCYTLLKTYLVYGCQCWFDVGIAGGQHDLSGHK